MSRLKILCVGDIHFKQQSLIPYYSEIDSNGISRELNRAIKSLKWIEDKVNRYKPDIVIQLGDVFHTLNQNENIVIAEAYKSIQSLYETCKKINSTLFIIGGNHDLYGNSNYITEILPCHCHFDKSDIFEYKGLKLAFIPYYDPEYRMWYEIQTTEADFIFTHTQVKNAYLNRKKKTTEGIDVEVIYDKYVISGHIHIPQYIGNVYYVGSLYQNTFSEQSVELSFGAALIDIGDEIRFIQIENDSVDKFITLTEDIFDEFLYKKEKEINKYFIRLITDNKDIAEELKKYTDKFIVLPEYRNEEKRIKEYSIDYNNLDTKNIIINYIDENFPYLKNKIKKYLGDS